MANTYRRRTGRRKKTFITPALVIIAMIILISAVISGVWHIMTVSEEESIAPDINEGLLNGPIIYSGNDDGELSVIPPAVVSLPAPAHPDEGTADRVGNNYFNDAAFVGDSITTGIKLYDVMSNADVFAETGLGLHNIMTRECIKMGDEKVTILEALNRTQPNKIYIMLGGNSLASATGDVFAAYDNFVTAIRAQHPDSIIYIQSMLPVHEAKFKAQYNKNMTNATIDEFNGMLKEMCTEKGYIYQDLASVFKDETGGMPSEYTPDGVHINSPQYIMWFDYLKENTLK